MIQYDVSCDMTPALLVVTVTPAAHVITMIHAAPVVTVISLAFVVMITLVFAMTPQYGYGDTCSTCGYDDT